MEALLIFIYKGEVNIEQKNLPALLKAAETLQIRGLSGGDIFAKESYKRLAELEQDIVENVSLIKEETPRKKQKVSKQQNNSILEKALTPRISQSENTNASTGSDQSGKDGESTLPDTVPNPVYHRLEMKVSKQVAKKLDIHDEMIACLLCNVYDKMWCLIRMYFR